MGGLRLGEKPEVVAILDRMYPAGEVASIARAGAGILEVRADCFEGPLERLLDYCARIREAAPMPIIGTVRENDQTRESRQAIFEAIAPHVDCVDIEIDAPIAPAVISLANGKTVMVSEHDFDGTPDHEGLQRIVDAALGMGANIVKIATMANCREDVTRLLRFTEECEANLVTMAMGPVGTISRVIAPLFGSLFTYGYIGEAVAPGQLPALELVALLERFFPAAP